MSKETGGPAFAQGGFLSAAGQNFTSEGYGGTGMTLRDYFAAKAIASIPLALDNGEQQVISTAAYRMADAMLEARKTQ